MTKVITTKLQPPKNVFFYCSRAHLVRGLVVNFHRGYLRGEINPFMHRNCCAKKA